MKISVLIGLAIIAYLIFGGSNKSSDNQSCSPIWEADARYNQVTFCTSAEASAKAIEIGCEGYHQHTQNGRIIFMSCATHEDLDPIINSTGGY